MYQNIYIEKPKQGKPIVHIWDDKKGYSKFQLTPYAYIKSQTGTYRSLYGDKLKKINFWTGDDLQKGNVFESDIPIETRVLVDNYTDSDDVAVTKKFLENINSVDGYDYFKDAKMKAEALKDLKSSYPKVKKYLTDIVNKKIKKLDVLVKKMK